ncbi:MAG: hypothetical protein Rsou_0102 [Candidatus Ruthia sp. Asou_11_S2]|nr:hypothetical protein [Candidatus Ruthia sp. Asou_11_S2]
MSKMMLIFFQSSNPFRSNILSIFIHKLQYFALAKIIQIHYI